MCMHLELRRKTKLTLKNYVQSFGCDFCCCLLFFRSKSPSAAVATFAVDTKGKWRKKERKKNQNKWNTKLSNRSMGRFFFFSPSFADWCQTRINGDKDKMQDKIRCQIVSGFRLLFQQESSAFGEKKKRRKNENRKEKRWNEISEQHDEQPITVAWVKWSWTLANAMR